MEILFVLLILLAIVTVVGHTIWIVLAAFLRAIFADDVVIADMDFDMIRDVRNVWQFFRDRRPETYGAITAL